MNRFLIILGLLLILLMISCQMPIPSPGEGGLFSLVANWGRTIAKTTDSEEGVFIHPTSDGGFVSLMETQTDNTERMIITNVKAVKLNATGGNEWVFSPALSDTSLRSGVFVLPNPFSEHGEYLIGIQKVNLGNDDTDVELFYVDEQGNKIWSMVYPGSGLDLLYGALFTSKNTIMAYGKTNSSDGIFDGKNQSTGFDGFVLEIDTFNGESRQTYFYDYLERDNGIKRIYQVPDSPEIFFMGEATNAKGVQKIWLMRVYDYQPTFKSQTLLFNTDDVHYFFGGMRRTGSNEYVMAFTKRTLDEEQVAFYKLTTNASFPEMVVEIKNTHEVNQLIQTDAREHSIGLSLFTDGQSLLAGVKAYNNVLTLNQFFLINTDTFEVSEQNYQYKQDVIYNHLSKKGDPQSYGLTGSVPSEEADGDERTAGGRACWVEGL
ncbi:MAG: hypothetical protein ACOC34_02950 [Thermotogota bacterium]